MQSESTYRDCAGAKSDAEMNTSIQGPSSYGKNQTFLRSRLHAGQNRVSR